MVYQKIDVEEEEMPVWRPYVRPRMSPSRDGGDDRQGE
jgi:hypothetical protein